MAIVAVAVVAVVAVYAATRTVSVPGQKLGDISAQTAKEGEPRLIVWGIVRPIGGNLVAVQEPPRIEKRKQKSGGKGGGGGSSSTSEHPHRTYAVGICEGAITGIRRVWRNNKLVYDGRPGSTWGRKNNSVFLKKARFYLGGYEQMPSADLEKIFGVGNVPAMRGTAYMVMADEDLSDMGGAVPQWLFEVVRAEGFALTSRPYAAENADGLTTAVRPLDGRLQGPVYPEPDALAPTVGNLGAELRSILREYNSGAESLSTAVGDLSATLRQISRTYNSAADLVDTDITDLSASLDKILVTYRNMVPESVVVDVTELNASLN